MKRAIKHITKQVMSWGYTLQRGGMIQKKVVLLGHMRCGSSLMVHILTSNPEIAGYGETHFSYCTASDLEKLPTNVYFNLRRFRPVRLVLDKILHDEYIVKDEILSAECCTFPIMAREALPSVSSMVTTLPGRFLKSNPVAEELLPLAADYYRSRLDTLCRYAEILSRQGKCWYFTYDDLIDRTARVFRMLEQSLELRHPLREHYAIGPTTGIHGYGDPSVNIKRGYIDRSIVRTSLTMPDKLSELLKKHYRSFDAHMRSISKCVFLSDKRTLVNRDHQSSPN